MNAAVATHEHARLPAAAAMPARVALLGTGTVGCALLARLAQWADTPLGARLSLVYAANSRFAVGDERGLCPREARSWVQAAVGNSTSGEGEAGAPATHTAAPSPTRRDTAGAWRRADGAFSGAHAEEHLGTSHLDHVERMLRDASTCIVIDATASDAVAARHAQWLGQGIHVVTACKLGQGTSLARWRAIQAASRDGRTQYGDSATVGAGLPLLSSIRALRAGGDSIHAIAGVLSGSLAWLFNHYDGLRPFSTFVREAREAGYTEPDPRDDLSGEDVRRKIVILARAAGVELEAHEVQVDSLVPALMGALVMEQVDAALPTLDEPLRQRFASAYKGGEKLRFIARLETNAEGPRARVGLESLAPDHPLAGGAGTDNRVAIWSDRYREQPLLIQGPGAGAAVTAAGLLDDVLRIATSPVGSWN